MITMDPIPTPSSLPWSFEQLYEAYEVPIHNYLYHLVGNHELASDLTQDTFLKVFRALSNLDSNAKISAWIYRIATNTAYDALRKKKLIAWLPWQDLAHEPADLENADPQETCEITDLVRSTLQRMPDGYRVALLLYTQKGLSYREIAQILHLAEGGVKMYLSRARESFRRHYRFLDQEQRIGPLESATEYKEKKQPCNIKITW